MKIRNGFISNSSSSSFMIGMAKIVDWEKFEKWISNFSPKDDYEITSLKDIKEDDYGITKKNNKIKMDSFTGSEVSIKIEDIEITEIENKPIHVIAYELLFEKEKNIFSINLMGVDGDEHFWNGDEYDYDKSLEELFNKKQIELYNGMTEENGLKYVDKTFGCGRNG